jgi:tRNA(Ile)-lysidine synthase
LNHGLRGAGSDADQSWLEALCRHLEIPLKTGRADTAAIASAQGDGIEAAAREARYKFLTETAEKLGARFVAVAHTADDQVETVLHRILRGSGLAGLIGMPAFRPLSPTVSLVRPLLPVRRAEILAYLETIGQDFRIDPTNADTRWTRNRVRHLLLPMLRREFNAGVDDALLRLAAQADESQEVITGLAEKLASGCMTIEGEVCADPTAGARRVEIDCDKLQGAPLAVVREVCRFVWRKAAWPTQSMGFQAWQSLAEMIQAPGPASHNLPGDIRARRERDRLVLENPGHSGTSPAWRC